MGRKKIPRAVREATGSAAKDPQRVNWNEPRLPAAEPVCPDDIAADERMKETWDFTIRQLRSMKTLSVANQQALELLCRHYSDYWRSRETLEAEGWHYVAANGSIRRHPAATEYNTAAASILKLLAEFGLTLSSMSKVKALSPSDAPDPLMDILKGRSNN